MEEAEVRENEERDDEESEEEESNGSSSNHVGDVRQERHAAAEDVQPGLGLALKNVVTITRRELRAYFDSLVGYVVICVSMLVLGVYFFLYQSGGFWQVDRATMSRLFEFMPWALASIVIPLVTMRALADEKRTGTIELLITM